MTAPLSLFVTGTDTEIGKTFVSAAMLHGFARHGLRAAALKPVAAGAYERDGVWRNEDAGAGLIAMLAADPEVTAHITAAELEALADPRHYLTHIDEGFARLGLA